MGAYEKPFSIQQNMRQAQTLFESQLSQLGLSGEQIEGETLEELQQSLETVNDSIQHPESFGTIKLKVTAEAGLVIAANANEAHYEIGVLPLLLERKKLILERIRTLKGERKIEDLRTLVKSVSDQNLRVKLEQELENLKAESQALSQQSKEVEQARVQEELEIQEEMAKLEIEIYERKAKIWQSFLEREPVASIVGSLLLFVLMGTQIVALFLKVQVPEIISDSFLMILGYFFGQAIIRRTSRTE